MMSGANDKGRYWSGLIYPGDSCPDDWQARMRLSGLRILVSPVHDKDIANVETGELKKPHRHVIAMWPNTTTRRNAERFFEQFHGPKTILRLESPRGMARYLIHLDDPDKAQYDPEDVIAFNGADWTELAAPENVQSQESSAIVQMIADNEIRSCYQLYKLCQQERPDLLDFVVQKIFFCREMVWSYWHAGNDKPFHTKEDDND